MKKGSINVILILSIFVSMLTVGSFVFFMKVIKNKNEHTSKVLNVLSEKMTNKRNAEALVDRISELELVMDRVNGHYVNSAKIDTFVDYLEKIGTDNNTELAVKNVEIPSSNKSIILAKVSVSGSFTNVMKVVYLLENIPYRSNLERVTINKEIKTEEVGTGSDVEKKQTSIWVAEVSFSVLTF